ncbi:MAG TPA: hypothetical protein VMV69_10325 [Pirellulales bacterium]|nr:hypothetical protein [Pirellulales bacterium]
MPQIFDCRFRQGESSCIHAVRAEFPDDVWAGLMGFLKHAETLFNCRALNVHLHFTLCWDAEAGFSFSGELPHDDNIATILHRMRPFVLQKEASYLPKMCKVLSRYITDAGFRELVKGIVDEFMGKGFQKQLKIDLNGSVLNTDDMVNKWLNAFEYHHAEDAKQALEVFRAVLPEAWQRAVFISMMLDKARQVGNTSIIVRWLDRRDNEPFVV